MYNLHQIEKQQVGLRLPRYLIEDIDQFTEEFSLNRSEIITEAIKSFISTQKTNMLYESFDRSCQEVNDIENKIIEETTLRELIDELKNTSNA